MAGTTVNNAHFDPAGVPTMMGVIGTLGTADTKGTALTIPIGADPATGAAYVYNLAPAGNVSASGTDPATFLPVRLTDGTTFYNATSSGGGTTVTVDHGTITLSNPTGTTVQFNNGTVNLLAAGTITKVEGGTVGLVTRVGNIGTLELGTISAMPNIPGGTLALVTTVTTLSNLSAGSVNIPAGTITSVTNLASGTLAQVTSVSNLVKGTSQSNPIPTINLIPFSTTSTGTIGTLVAAPSAGSSVWINDVSINSHNGTVDALVSYGLTTNGTSVILRGNYGAQGGQQRSFPSAINGGGITGSAVTFNILGGSGTVTYNISYFIGTP